MAFSRLGSDGGELTDNSGIGARRLMLLNLRSPLAVGRPGASRAEVAAAQHRVPPMRLTWRTYRLRLRFSRHCSQDPNCLKQ
jgi:hypothetical protein